MASCITETAYYGPTEAPEYQAEYQHTYQAVLTAYAHGYHLPYSNTSSDEAEWLGYHDGFRAALRQIEAEAR